LSGKATVYLDTNIFLNVVYKELPFQASSAALLRRIQANDLHAISSAVTIAEIMLDMDKSGFGVEAEKALSAIEDIRYLSIVPLDKDMSREAARYVLKDKITVHDAYHLATALRSEAQYFVTRDKSLSNKIKTYIGAATPEQVP
jgi:predicted nucleic acid-binding protein